MEDMTRKEDMNKKEDKLILGGHEFNSRFILGSGKYNVNLIKGQLSRAVLKLSHLLLDVPIQRIKRIFLISYRRE